MGISESDFKAIERIFNYVVKANISPVQKYDPIDEYRLNIMIAKELTHKDIGYCSEVYINLQKLTDWQRKNFEIRSQKILPDRWYIDQQEKITRIGFK